ncbi:MAG TPA: glycosyltransferase family 9 protein [Pyrinomonadaceae bacterium]|nr:glycosyltransferase family 9 protein [Pyrinomonadaceae bacterium]
MNVLQTSAARPAPESATRARMGEAAPRPLAPARWDWDGVRRVLVVRLRSIGDTVLSTPSLYALRRFLPDAQIDLLLEDWVAPLLDGNPDASRILTVKRNSTASRLSLVRRLRAARYDVAFNLHGGSTAALLTRASGARRRVGYASYRFSRLHNHAAPPATDLWRQAKTHSVEQQLGLLGWAGVPVTDRPATRLFVTAEADARIARKLDAAALPASQPFALFHPAAAFDSKRWDARNFARVAARLDALGLAVVAVAAPGENDVVRAFAESAPETRVVAFNDLALPEVVALAARARLFVGNDSGIAHIAAAVRTPSVVVFGSSNVAHWRPWTDAPAEVVREEMSCAPCAGYTCGEFAEAQCIRRVTVEGVNAAVERVLAAG